MRPEELRQQAAESHFELLLGVDIVGIISFLDERHSAIVKRIWAELNAVLDDSSQVRSLAFPHFTYHVAEQYQLPLLLERLKRISEQTERFFIRTTGLGIFSGGENPVLYIPIVRDGSLSLFQGRVWETASELSIGEVVHYHPRNWVPHIELVAGNPIESKLPTALHQLFADAFKWEIEIHNLTYARIGSDPEHVEDVHSFKLVE